MSLSIASNAALPKRLGPEFPRAASRILAPACYAGLCRLKNAHKNGLGSMSVNEFLQMLATPMTGEVLFDHLSDVVYFIKDAQGAYLVVNKTLAERCRAQNKQAILGKTSAEVLGEPLGQRFTAQDEQVLSTGNPLISQLELHIHRSGLVGWCLTTKLPLRDKKGKVIGLVGVSQDLKIPDRDTQEYRQVALAIQSAEKNIASPPKIKEMATWAGMSIYQLDRRMQSIFGLTTGQWLLKTRIDRAQRLLSESDRGIAAIAVEVGYADQSAFSRQFRSATSLTPNQFRSASRTTPK